MEANLAQSVTTPPPRLIRILRVIDSISIASGKLFAWLIFPMVGSLVYEVAARYLFDSPTLWAYDMTFMFYGTFFMMGAAYTLQQKGHIRTDVLYGGWSIKRQGWVDSACYLLFFFPAMIAFLVVTWDYFALSYSQNERNVTSSWMPIVYPFKFVMPLSTALLLAQGVSEFLKSLYAARKGVWL